MTREEQIQLKRAALSKYYGHLNEPQRQAVFTVNGPVLVLAGAGSGKTTAIIHRIMNMVNFGDAYEAADATLTEQEAALLQAYVDGTEELDLDTMRELLAVAPIRPWNILAITFTNKAAGEMRERLLQSIGEEQAQNVTMATFHSACVRILRRSIHLLGYERDFTIYDSDDSKRLMKACIADADLSEQKFPPKAILTEISFAKDNLQTPEDLKEDAGGDYRKLMISKLYQAYQTRLRNSNALDFDDLITCTVQMLRENPEELAYYQNKYRYLLVDEYQDTNHAQFELLRLLSAGHQNLCVVGDDDQSIYRFRGATIENILGFESQFPSCKVIRLEQNYRSTQTILDAANGVISNNEGRKEKHLWTDSGKGAPIICYRAANEADESDFIVKQIEADLEQGGSYQNHAVLYRMNAQSNSLERAFVKHGIPYRIYGGTRFYDRKEIKDMTAYMSVINNPYDMLRLKRIINEPKRGIGEATVSLIEDIVRDLHLSPIEVLCNASDYPVLAKRAAALKKVGDLFCRLTEQAEQLPMEEFLDCLLEESGYQAAMQALGEEGITRLENIAELKSSMIQYEKEAEEASLRGFLEEIALYTDVDQYEPQQDVVSLMTIHAAKGLEFSSVYLVGMEDGLFPNARCMDSQTEMEEERRLAYVAITRAKKQLFISNTASRMLFGTCMHNLPSRFLREIDPDLLQKVKSTLLVSQKINSQNEIRTVQSMSLQQQLAAQRKKPTAAAKVAYATGERVLHPSFGEGTILSIKQMANDAMLEIGFDKVGTKKIMANYAKMKKI